MAQITDQYVIDTTQFQAEVEKVLSKYNLIEKGANDAGKAGVKGAKDTGAEMKKLEKQGGTLQSSFKKLGVAMAAAFSVGKVKQFLEASVEAANVQLQAEAKLLQALKGREDVMNRLKQRASEIQKVTTIGDEAIIQQQAFLAAQGRTEEEINKTIDAAVQLSAVMGTDLGTAIMQLDGTLEGNVGRLAKLDSGFKDLTEEQLKNGAAIDLINEKYQGFAETQATTGTGALKQLQNSFGDLMENIGAQLIPMISKLAGYLKGLTEWVVESGAISKAFDFVKKAWEPIFKDVGKIFDNLKRVFAVFNSEGENTIDWMKVLMATVKLAMLPMRAQYYVAVKVSGAIAFLAEKISAFVKVAREALAPVDALFNSLGKLGSWVADKLGISFTDAIDPLEKYKKALEGLTDEQKIKRLEGWKKQFEGNADAIKMIDKEIMRLRLSMASSTDAYVKNVEERKRADQEYLVQRQIIARRIEDLELQLISNGQIREEKASELKFQRMREDAEKEFNEKKITLTELSRITDLAFKLEQAEEVRRQEERANFEKKQLKQAIQDELKAEADKAKARADFLKNYTIPTLEEIFEQEKASLSDALANNLITYEEYYNILSELEKKYYDKKRDFEQAAADEMLASLNKSVGLASQGIRDIISVLGGEQSDFAEFTKALAVFDIAMQQGIAIANAISGATAAAAAGGPAAPFLLAGYIASMVGAVVAGFAQAQQTLSAEPPRYFEGTDFVKLGGNKRGKDTIPAMLNEGEAVIPTDANAQYPGLAKAWLNNDLTPYIHRNFVSPALKRQREEMQMKQWKEMGSAMVANFDDYRLHKDLTEQTTTLRQGFASLKPLRTKVRGRS